MACVLVLSMAFVFVSCEKVKVLLQGEDNSTTTMIEDEDLLDNSYNDNNASNSDNTAVEGVVFFGEWHYDETTTPQEFYGDFYDSEITQTNVTLRTIYDFRSDGTFSKRIEIVNISEVRKEYRKLMVSVGRKKLQSQGRILTTDDVLYYENYADEVLKDICTAQEGTYDVGNNRIIYTIDGETIYETYTVNGNKLTITGSSKTDIGYPKTMTKL